MDRESMIEHGEESIGSMWERIETNFEVSEAFERRGAFGPARRYLRVAWNEYVQFTDVLHAYLDSGELGERLVAAMVRSGHSDLFVQMESQEAGARLPAEASVPALAA